MKFWWPLLLAMKFTFLFLNLAKIHIFISKCTEGECTGLGNIPKEKNFFYCFPIIHRFKQCKQCNTLFTLFINYSSCFNTIITINKQCKRCIAWGYLKHKQFLPAIFWSFGFGRQLILDLFKPQPMHPDCITKVGQLICDRGAWFLLEQVQTFQSIFVAKGRLLYTGRHVDEWCFGKRKSEVPYLYVQILSLDKWWQIINAVWIVVGDTQSDSIQCLNFAKKWFIQ